MAVSDIRNYVYRVVDAFPGPLKTPARWVADRLFGVWNEIFEHLSTFRSPWTYLNAKLKDIAWTAAHFATVCTRTVRWLIVEAIPRWSRWARDNAVSWARQELTRLNSLARGWIADARNYLMSQIRQVTAFAHDVWNWAVARVREIWVTLNVVRDRVVRYLTNPETLVDWLFLALWRRFWRFTNDHAETLAAYAWSRRDRIIAQALVRLESFLMRLL